MKNIINKIKNVKLEQINKNLLLIALLSLIYRLGSFYNSFIPKPFEMIFAVVIILTIVDLIKNNKIKSFFLSISKKIWIAVGCLVFSILLGWAISIFFKKIPLDLNTILEFGTFSISLGVFLLVLFYARKDSIYYKKYFYALLLPTLYIVFILFQSTANYLYLVKGTFFNGLTMNVNVFSKTLFVPVIFFIVKSLFELKNKWLKIGYIFISSGLFALLLWTGSRGAILSLVLGVLFTWLIFLLYKFNWRKLLLSACIIFSIFFLGFMMASNYVTQTFLNRILSPSSVQLTNMIMKGESISKIAQESGVMKKDQNFVDKKSFAINDLDGSIATPETRLLIWPYYLKQIIRNPLGIGPNTHFVFDNYFIHNSGQGFNNGPHNTYLQIWLWGGVLGLLSFLYILWTAFKNLNLKLKSHFDLIGVVLIVSLITLSISIMFDDSLSFYWFFIILALSLGYEKNIKD